MKNLSLILNAVLIVAVAILYYLQFSCNDSCTASEVNDISAIEGNDSTLKDDDITASIVEIKPTVNQNIVFLNLDTLNAKSSYIQKLSNTMGAKTKQKSDRLETQKRDFQQQYKIITDNYQMGVYKTEQQLLEKQQQLAQAEQALMQEEQKVLREIEAEKIKLTKQINKKVTDYLKKYSEKYGYSAIIATGSGSNVMFSSDSLDITTPVISSFNAQ